MNTSVFIAGCFIIFFLISIGSYYLMMVADTFWKGLAIATLYFFLVYLIFDRAMALHRYFRGKQIYIELGHADIVLILSFFSWLLMGLATVMLVVRRKTGK